MYIVDKELWFGKFKLNVFNSDYLSTDFIVYLFRFWNVLLIYTFFTFLTLDIRDLKSRFGQTAKALGLVSPHYIRTKVRLRAVSYFSFESQWSDSTEHTWGASGEAARNEGDLTFLLAVRASEETRTTARGLQKSAFQGSTGWIAFYLLP